jgi:hypothetical protein
MVTATARTIISLLPVLGATVRTFLFSILPHYFETLIFVVNHIVSAITVKNTEAIIHSGIAQNIIQ